MLPIQPETTTSRYLRRLLLIAVVSVAAVACGSSATDQTTTTAPASGTQTSTPTDDATETAFATSSLPDGLRPWWESTHRTAAFLGSNYLLAASDAVEPRGANPAIVVLRLDGPDTWENVGVSIPASASSADMFMSGSKLVVTYLDPAGAIVVLSTGDGSSFETGRLEIPDRYVEANSWSHTSLTGTVVGAADLGADVFAVANTGITWPRPDDLARPYAIEENPDNEDSIRYAGTIRTTPTGDGDFLFVFEQSGEVVAEVLASDAGIDDGYIEAYRQRSDDTFESQSWLINGSTTTNLNTPPFNGQSDIEVHSIYPVDGGVAAMVSDFNAGANAEGASLRNGATAERGLHTPGTSAIRTGESAWSLRSMITLDGYLWAAELALGVTNPQFGSLAWARFGGIPLFILAFFTDDGAHVAVSDDGAVWAVADDTLDISLEGGNEVQVVAAGPNTAHIYSSVERSYKEFKLEYDESSGTVIIEPSVESVIPELSTNSVAVRTTPTPAEVQAAEDVPTTETRFGAFGPILFFGSPRQDF